MGQEDDLGQKVKRLEQENQDLKERFSKLSREYYDLLEKTTPDIIKNLEYPLGVIECKLPKVLPT